MATTFSTGALGTIWLLTPQMMPPSASAASALRRASGNSGPPATRISEWPGSQRIVKRPAGSGPDSILAAPIALDLVLFLDLAKRTPELRSIGIQEWLSFYLKSPQTAAGLYPEHDLFIQSMKLKNTLRHIMGQGLITHLGLEYYD